VAIRERWAVLEVSDGTTTVNLLQGNRPGFHLADWNPAIAALKGGGAWQDSPLATGRRLVDKRFGNVTDSLSLAVNGVGQNETIQRIQDLLRLLEKARSFTATDWQTDPVYLKRRASCEDNASYALIFDYTIPQLDNPYAAPFFNASRLAAMDDFTLGLEHSLWLADVPGDSTCVQASGQQTWDYEGWVLNTNQPAEWVRSLYEVPSTGTLLAGETDNFWRSTDGENWNQITPIVAPGTICAILEASDGYLYAGADNGIWRSADDGVTWTQRCNAAEMSVDGGYNAGLVELGAYLYATEGNNGSGDIKRSSDGGVNWTTVIAGNGTSALHDIIRIADTLVAETYNSDVGKVAYSTDGTNWSPVVELVNEYAVSGSEPAPTSIKLITPGDGYAYAIVYAAPYHVWRSADGTTWTLLGNAGDALAGLTYDAINGWLYGVEGADIYVSRDGGYSWTAEGTIPSSGTPMAYYSYNGRIYVGQGVAAPAAGNIYQNGDTVTVGQAATCADDVIIANKANLAQLTNVQVFDASGPSYTERFPAATFPYALFPDPLVDDDALIVTIDSGLANGGPFCVVVFDLSIIASGTYTVTWYYPSGAAAFPPPGANWTALNIEDGTDDFVRRGVGVLNFVPPSDWTTITINGVTGYHIVALISGVAGTPTAPQQGGQDPYTVNWPCVDIDDGQVGGDVPALLRFRLHNRSDEDAYASDIDELDLLENRVIAGLRNLGRGADFIAYLNCSDEQNPNGVTAADGANTSDVADIDHPTGRSMEHTTTGSSAWTDECTFTLGPTVARDFYGTYHAFLRAQLESFTNDVEDVRIRLQVRTGSGGVKKTTDWLNFPNCNDWQLLDFGRVVIPASGVLGASDLGDEAALVVQIWSSEATLVVNLYDLILIPTDEWAGDFTDNAYEDDSGVSNDKLLDVDSVGLPKVDIRSMVREADSDFITSIYLPVTPEPAILQANADQRLWFLTARAVVTGTHTGANNATTLTDTGASFLTSNVEAGQIIYNVTDDSVGVVGSTVTATTISDCSLAGGAGDDWDTNDEYVIIAPNWKSEPWNLHSVQLYANARYLGMRGDR